MRRLERLIQCLDGHCSIQTLRPLHHPERFACVSACIALGPIKSIFIHLYLRALHNRAERLLQKSGSSTNTRQRERDAEIISNDGFSVVAPMSVNSPLSTYGNRKSCWLLLNRCISSKNNTLFLPFVTFGEVGLTIFLISSFPARPPRAQRVLRQAHRIDSSDGRLACPRTCPTGQMRRDVSFLPQLGRLPYSHKVFLPDDIIKHLRSYSRGERFHLSMVLLSRNFVRTAGVGPALIAWKATVIPLDHVR